MHILIIQARNNSNILKENSRDLGKNEQDGQTLQIHPPNNQLSPNYTWENHESGDIEIGYR